MVVLLLEALKNIGSDEESQRYKSSSEYADNFYYKEPKKQRNIDAEIMKERREVSKLRKREELKELRRLKEKLKNNNKNKSLRGEVVDTLAPPTDSGTSEDIIAVFTGIGSNSSPPVDEDGDPFDWKPGDFSPGEPDNGGLDFNGMNDLEPPIKDEELEEVLGV